MLHPLPFLLPDLCTASVLAYGVGAELLAPSASIRFHFMHSPLGQTIFQVIVGGAVVFGVGGWLGGLGAQP